MIYINYKRISCHPKLNEFGHSGSDAQGNQGEEKHTLSQRMHPTVHTGTV